jgi:hypothetical protein
MSKLLKSNEHSNPDRTYHSRHQSIRFHYSYNTFITDRRLKKQDTSPIVLKLTALEMTDLHYPEKDLVRIYTDGSKADEANTEV